MMESLIQLRKRLSHWVDDGGGADGLGHKSIRKIKIVRTEGTINYDLVDSSGAICDNPNISFKNNEVLSANKSFTASPFIVRVEPLPKQRNLLRRIMPQMQEQQSISPSESRIVCLKPNNQRFCDPYEYDNMEDDQQSMRKFSFRQRRCANPSLTDDEVRSAYAKLKLTPPMCSYDEMNESERGIYRFVRRRLMNKNSARQSRLRRKELFKEYENTINVQAQNLHKTENKLRMLLTCFLNAVTLISLQSIPQMINPTNLITNGDNNMVIGDNHSCQCDKIELFNNAMLDAINAFGQDCYSDSEGIQQLLVDLRVCSHERPIHQLLQRQERSLNSIFHNNGIKDIICKAAGGGIPQWKLSLITSNALRSAWSIFLGPNEQGLLFEDHNQSMKQESTTAFFESFVNELFDPLKHAELLKSLNGNGCDPDQSNE